MTRDRTARLLFLWLSWHRAGTPHSLILRPWRFAWSHPQAEYINIPGYLCRWERCDLSKISSSCRCSWPLFFEIKITEPETVRRHWFYILKRHNLRILDLSVASSCDLWRRQFRWFELVQCISIYKQGDILSFALSFPQREPDPMVSVDFVQAQSFPACHAISTQFEVCFFIIIIAAIAQDLFSPFPVRCLYHNAWQRSASSPLRSTNRSCPSDSMLSQSLRLYTLHPEGNVHKIWPARNTCTRLKRVLRDFFSFFDYDGHRICYCQTRRHGGHVCGCPKKLPKKERGRTGKWEDYIISRLIKSSHWKSL